MPLSGNGVTRHDLESSPDCAGYFSLPAEYPGNSWIKDNQYMISEQRLNDIATLALVLLVILPIIAGISVALNSWQKHNAGPNYVGKHWRVWRDAILAIVISAGVGFLLFIAWLTS
ncbi:hypothetical protein [Escherichia albertii]|uniref:hypothetical protein n=1 Tax=Escherichia albertii TaxID=208962 RepID=UPI001EDC0152|nr:hypothetical protein [Escherichia albertii]